VSESVFFLMFKSVVQVCILYRESVVVICNKRKGSKTSYIYIYI
jgi:hypothetical protein